MYVPPLNVCIFKQKPREGKTYTITTTKKKNTKKGKSMEMIFAGMFLRGRPNSQRSVGAGASLCLPAPPSHSPPDIQGLVSAWEPEASCSRLRGTPSPQDRHSSSPSTALRVLPIQEAEPGGPRSLDPLTQGPPSPLAAPAAPWPVAVPLASGHFAFQGVCGGLPCAWSAPAPGPRRKTSFSPPGVFSLPRSQGLSQLCCWTVVPS